MAAPEGNLRSASSRNSSGPGCCFQTARFISGRRHFARASIRSMAGLFAYNESTFAQEAAIVTTPNGGDGGFWMSGAGHCGRCERKHFCERLETGHSTPQTFPPQNWVTACEIFRRQSWIVGLLHSLQSTQPQIEATDDLGSGGVLLLPKQPGNNPDLLVQAG